MTTAERNKQLREMANLVAAEVKKVVGTDFPRQVTPYCHRIVRRRGRGYTGGSFSVPSWAERVTEYFIYYAAHEAIHCLIEDSGHGRRFMEAESKALAAFGLRPEYGEGSPYVERLYDIASGNLICTKTKTDSHPIPA